MQDLTPIPFAEAREKLSFLQELIRGFHPDLKRKVRTALDYEESLCLLRRARRP